MKKPARANSLSHDVESHVSFSSLTITQKSNTQKHSTSKYTLPLIAVLMHTGDHTQDPQIAVTHARRTWLFCLRFGEREVLRFKVVKDFSAL